MISRVKKLNEFHFISRILPLLLVVSGPLSHAAVFNSAYYVEPSQWVVGLEPELTLNETTQGGAGLGGNLSLTYGLNDLMNASVLIGAGDGPRQFRVGGGLTFDFFPDVEGQPGIGLATKSIYYRSRTEGHIEALLIPYIHKKFSVDGSAFDPFLAIPFGLEVDSSQTRPISNFVIGSLFKADDQFRWLIELGINVHNSRTYVSGGVIYSL